VKPPVAAKSSKAKRVLRREQRALRKKRATAVSRNKKRTHRWFPHTFGIASSLRAQRKTAPVVLPNTNVFSESSESSRKKISRVL